MGRREDAAEIALIISAETGDLIKVGDCPDVFYPVLLKAMQQMRDELVELRRRFAPHPHVEK